MSLDSDLLLDRRRLKRRLFLWRAVAVLALLATAAAGLWRGGGLAGGDYVARVSVSGVIAEDRRRVAAIAAVARDPRARALIVAIDSPGGTVAGGESLHAAIAAVAAAKPVVAVMGGTAASAGYMAAVPAARIFAREATLTGSIGVKLGLGEVSGLLERLGIGTETIASGPLKDQPSLTRPLSAEGRAAMQSLVDDMHDQFVGMVVAGRGMAEAQVRTLADGRAYTGRQALRLGLIDAIGGEAEARAWLAQARQVGRELQVREIGGRELSDWLSGEAAGALLMGALKTVLSQGLSIDGGRIVWQAE